MTDQQYLTKLEQAGYTVPESDRLEWVLTDVLPSYIYSEQYEQKAWLWLRKNTKDWNAWYWVNDPKYGEDQISEHGITAPSPLSAALRLACALLDAGVLKGKV